MCSVFSEFDAIQRRRLSYGDRGHDDFEKSGYRAALQNRAIVPRARADVDADPYFSGASTSNKLDVALDRRLCARDALKHALRMSTRRQLLTTVSAALREQVSSLASTSARRRRSKCLNVSQKLLSTSHAADAFDSEREVERLLENVKANWAFDARAHGARAALMPRRRCMGMDRHFPRDFMVRYVLAKDEMKQRWVMPDVRGDLPGRGVYVSSSPSALEATVKRQGFQMGFKNKSIQVPESLQKITEMQLRRHLGEVFVRACQTSQDIRPAHEVGANAKHKDVAPIARRSVEDEVKLLLAAQKQNLPDTWLILPSDLSISSGVSIDNNSSETRKAESDEVPSLGYKLFMLSAEELLKELNDSGINVDFSTKVRVLMARATDSGDIADFPALVEVDDEVSFRLRIAQLRLKLWMQDTNA